MVNIRVFGSIYGSHSRFLSLSSLFQLYCLLLCYFFLAIETLNKSYSAVLIKRKKNHMYKFKLILNCPTNLYAHN